MMDEVHQKASPHTSHVIDRRRPAIMDAQDRCAVCDDPRSTERDQILYCDGPGCNMPVHQYCYGVREIPEGDWFCQRCYNKRFYRKVNIICCTTQTGAIKRTTESTEFMHVQCSIYNKEIDHTKYPYLVDKSKLGQLRCALCLQQQGFCARCEEPGCPKSFHVTCGINAGLIQLSRIPPQNPSYRCGAHLSNVVPSADPQKPGNPTYPSHPFSKVSNNIETARPLQTSSMSTPSSGLLPSKRSRTDSPTASSPKMRNVAPPKTEISSTSFAPAASRSNIDGADYAKVLILESEVAYLKQKLTAAQEEAKRLRNAEKQAQNAQERLEHANQQIERLRRELQKQSNFKKVTTEILTTLNIKTANVSPIAERMDEYVVALRDTLERTGPPRPEEWRHIVQFSHKLCEKRTK